MSTLLKSRFSGRRGPIGSVLLTVLLIGAGLVVAAPSPASAAVPSAPTRVSVLASDASVRVAWFSPDDDGGQDITSYQITASTGTVFSVLDAPVTLSGFSNGVPVSFRVAAINSDGIGPASPPSAAVTPTAKTLTNTWSAGSLMTTGR